jgi:hypothetical protein
LSRWGAECAELADCDENENDCKDDEWENHRA